MVGRSLTPSEIDGYDHVDGDLLASVRILRVPFLSPGTSGMALGGLVMLTDDSDRSGRSPLMAHELVHVKQFAERGRTSFLLDYLRHYFRGLMKFRNHREAYLAIPAEVEARNATKAWAEQRPDRRR